MFGWLPKSSDPPPPPEPVYSELGSEVYRLLEEKEGEWHVNSEHYHRPIDRGIGHTQSRLFIEVTDKDIWIRQGREDEDYLNRLMTTDDIRRISHRVRHLMAERIKQKQYDDMKKALERLKPNRFDADCRELARCVLKGDDSAVRPLLDKCMEALNG